MNDECKYVINTDKNIYYLCIYIDGKKACNQCSHFIKARKLKIIEVLKDV